MLRGVGASTVWNWRNRDKSVPAHHVLAIYEQRVIAAGLAPAPPAPHRCEYLDFTAMVAGYNAMRTVVLALAEDPKSPEQRRDADRIMRLAEGEKKRQLEG
jgi:hypothetical protein